MNEEYTGVISVLYEVDCYHCQQYENLPHCGRKRFVQHLEKHGWKKHNGKWHCKFCYEKVTKQ